MNYSMSRRHHHIKTRQKIRDLRLYNKLLIVYSTVITVALIGAAYLYMSKSNSASAQFQQYEASIAKLTEKNDTLLQTNTTLLGAVNDLSEDCENLTRDKNSLIACNNEMHKEIEEFRAREELYDKYEYALYYYAKRTDITYDQLRMLECTLDDSYAFDTDFILTWAMTESTGNEKVTNSSSGAKGFGQFMDGTSKYVYTKLLGNDESDWCAEVAYDGTTNFQMMIAYCDYLYDRSGSIRGMLSGYTGYGANSSELDAYIAKMDKYLKKKSKSVSSYY